MLKHCAYFVKPRCYYKPVETVWAVVNSLKKLREEEFKITRNRVINLMMRFNLVVKQRVAYKETTKRKHRDAVADNLLNMNFTRLQRIKYGGMM